MKHQKLALLSFSTILPLVLIWTGIVAGGEKKPITIGIVQNEHFAYADMMKKSFALALADIHRQGGINGRRLKLAYADDGGDKRQGVEAVRQLLENEHAVMLTGGYSSSNTLAMAQKADNLDIPFLVCTASDDRITRHKLKNIFRLSPPAREYARGLERLLQLKLQPESMAIIYENSPFGTGGATRMMWFCRENGIRITAIVPYHKERAAAAYFDRIIEPLKPNPPQMIYLVSYKRDGMLMVQRLRAARITSHLLGGAGGFTHPDFIPEAGDASDYMMTATLWTPDLPFPLARRYARRYQVAYANERPDYHGAEAYAALVVVADALRRASSLKPADIRDALAQTRISTPFGQVAFAAYDGFERQNRQPTLVLQAINGRYACIWPTHLSMAEMVLPLPGRLLKTGIKEASR